MNRRFDASVSELAELRQIAGRLARDAGTQAAAGRRSESAPDTDTKSSPSDLVTKYDREAEEMIVDWLQQHRPQDAIVGEEGSAIAGASGLEWHIDPIDGTTNFVYDLPAWACSVAVRAVDPDASAHGLDAGWKAGATLAGAVYVPALDELFDAARGGGAQLNARPLSVNPIDDVTRALIGTGFSFDPHRRGAQAGDLVEIVPKVRDIRRSGSAAVDLCFVAAGRYDAYFETGLNSWDMAAGELIAIEAGATSSDFSGGPTTPEEVLVTAPGIHDSMVSLLSNRSV